MKDTVIFHLAKHFPPHDPAWKLSHEVDEPSLYDQIRNGDKTSEWRDASPYWFKRLLRSANLIVNTEARIDLSKSLKLHKAWFVHGYPKHNLPRLEADITAILLHGESQQFEIQFKVVREVMSYLQKQYRELGRILQIHRAQHTALLFTVPKEMTR